MTMQLLRDKNDLTQILETDNNNNKELDEKVFLLLLPGVLRCFFLKVNDDTKV